MLVAKPLGKNRIGDRGRGLRVGLFLEGKAMSLVFHEILGDWMLLLLNEPWGAKRVECDALPREGGCNYIYLNDVQGSEGEMEISGSSFKFLSDRLLNNVGSGSTSYGVLLPLHCWFAIACFLLF